MASDRKSLLDRVSTRLSEQISRTTLDAAVAGAGGRQRKRPRSRYTGALVVCLLAGAVWATYFLADSESETETAQAAAPFQGDLLERTGVPVMTAQEKVTQFLALREAGEVGTTSDAALQSLILHARRLASEDPSSALILASLALDLSPTDPAALRLKEALEQGLNLRYQDSLELRADGLGPMTASVYRDSYVIASRDTAVAPIDYSRDIFGNADAFTLDGGTVASSSSGGADAGDSAGTPEPGTTTLPPGVLESAAESPTQ